MNIQRDITDDRLCILTFDRPDSSTNLFDRPTLEELGHQLDFVTRESSLRGVVFMTAKDRVFLAGADVTGLVKGVDPDELRSFIELGQSTFTRVADLKIPSVAAIHGACLGGGYELCLACDYRIATPDDVTRIGLPEVTLGILPAWGGSTRLPHLIGVSKALDMILTGEIVSAREARENGMVDLVAPREYLRRGASDFVERGKPHGPLSLGRSMLSPFLGSAVAPAARTKLKQRTRGHYPAPEKALEIVTRSGSVRHEQDSLMRERDAVLELAGTETCKNLVRLFFLRERSKKLTPEAFPGVFTGKEKQTEEKKGAPGATIDSLSTIAVIGAGVMGAGITQWLTTRGFRVMLWDVDNLALAAGMQRVSKLLEKAVNRQILSKIEARDAMDRISPVTDGVPLHRVDLVIEAAAERIEVKKKIFAELDREVGPNAILATNTSALSISEIAAATQNPHRVIGLHFFNPVHKMPLVEVGVGKETSRETGAAALRFVQRIGKLPVLVKDSPGFVVNRILVPYLLEAGRYFERGAKIQDVDEAMLQFGMPMGPLRLIDEIGADVAANVADSLTESLGERLPPTPSILQRLIDAGLLGKKSGHGFYDHNHKEPLPNDGIVRFRSTESISDFDYSELMRRMSMLMIAEAARCVEDGIVAGPDDIDFAMVMGAGFAPFRGGPLRFADKLGLKLVVDELNKFAATAGAAFVPCDLLVQKAAQDQRFYAD